MGRVFRCNLSIFRRAFGESKYRQITSKDESHIFHTDFLLEHNPFITPLKIIDRLYWSRNFNKKKHNGITQPEHSKQQLCVWQTRDWYSLTQYFILGYPCLDRVCFFKQRFVLIKVSRTGSRIYIVMIGCWAFCAYCTCDIRFLCNIYVFYITLLGRCNKSYYEGLSVLFTCLLFTFSVT